MLNRASYRWVVLAGIAAGLVTSARAEDAKGTWMRSDGVARVRIAGCGAALCGTITWVKDPNGPGKVGQKVFFDMAPSGPGTWAGSAFNPEDGNTYSGKMSVSGGTLTTTGCALGGLICKSLTWWRAG